MKSNKKRFITVSLIIAILALGMHWVVTASTEGQMTIDFDDSVLCSKIANNLRTYKNNANEKSVNYLISSTEKSITINESDLKNIKKLDLSGSSDSSGSSTNQITNLNGIASFTYLEELNLANSSKISNHNNAQSNIHEIYRLTNLKVLSLSGTAIYNDDIYSTNSTYNISNLTNLIELNLSSTNISSNGLYSELSALSNLEKLDVSNNLNVNNLSQIINWVKDLNIENTRITDIENIRTFNNLEVLTAGHNSITNIGCIYETRYVESLEDYIPFLNKLKKLNLDYMNEGYKAGNILSYLQPLSLNSLSLRGNDIYDLSGLVQVDDDNLLKMQDTLQYLDLADNQTTNIRRSCRL